MTPNSAVENGMGLPENNCNRPFMYSEKPNCSPKPLESRIYNKNASITETLEKCAIFPWLNLNLSSLENKIINPIIGTGNIGLSEINDFQGLRKKSTDYKNIEY